MELIYTDENGVEQGYLSFASSDIDIGDTNDFEIVVGIKNNSLDYGYRIFADGTEYGGIVRKRIVDTNNNCIYYDGPTWRGILAQKIVCPLCNQDYYVATGNFSNVCTLLLSYVGLNSLFLYDTTSSDVDIGTYQFKRYDNLLNGFVEMLANVNYRLKIRYNNGFVNLSAVPIRDFSDEIELSSDGNVNVKIENDRGFTNHLICLGTGELAQRTVVHLYYQSDGTVGTKQAYFGVDEIVDVYDYPNAESPDELVASGKEKFEGLIKAQKMEVNVSNIEVETGDIIGGREYITGQFIKRAITDKIVKTSNGKTKISYKVGE